jgi:hypothetical protein
MADIFPPSRQRPALLALAGACDTRASALRRDECGDWAIWGNNGHVYAVPEGFHLMIGCDFDNARWTSARGWESAKKRLGFGRVTQDGDEEGSIILDRLPSKAEAREIRYALGIPQARHLSEERRALMSEIGAANLTRPCTHKFQRRGSRRLMSLHPRKRRKSGHPRRSEMCQSTKSLPR